MSIELNIELNDCYITILYKDNIISGTCHSILFETNRRHELADYLQHYCEESITDIKIRKGKYQTDIYGDSWKSYILIVK